MANDIGNITASLKLESAAFIREMNRAAQATAKSTTAMQRSMASLNASFATVGKNVKGLVAGFVSVAAVRSLASLGKQAIQTADDIGAAATKMGLTTHELQGLQFAAAQADVEFGQLEAVFRKFQAQVATGKVKVEAESMGEAFVDAIEKIRQAPDAAAKAAVAIQNFGQKGYQAGILLAEAGEEFGKNFDNAARISEDAIKIAGRLDNEFRAIQDNLSAGFATGFLESFAEGVGTSAEELENFKTVAQGLGSIVGTVTGWVASMASAFANLRQTVFDAREEIRKAQAERAGETFIPTLDERAVVGGLKAAGEKVFGEKPAGGAPPLGVGVDQAKAEAQAARDAAAAQREYNTEREHGLALVAQTFSPIEEYNALMKETSTLHLSAADAARVQQAAQLELASSYVNAASQVTSTLAGAFQDNNAFAIANAVMNVAQGISQALTLPFPLNWAQVAAVTAAGIQQIATIKNARPGSSSKPSASGGKGASATRSATGGDGEAAIQDRAVFINLQGSGRYSRMEVQALIEQLIDAQKDGARLVLAQP